MPPAIVIAIEAFAAAIGTTMVLTAVQIGYIANAIFVGASMLYGSAAKRRAAKKQQDSARDAFLASLQTKMVTKISVEAPVTYVYGEDRVGVNIVAMFTDGPNENYKHLVCVFANHEVQSIDEIYVANKPLGALDGNGYTTYGGDNQTESFRGDAVTYALPDGYSNLVIKAGTDNITFGTTLVITTNYTISSAGVVTLLGVYATSARWIQVSLSPNAFYKYNQRTGYTANLVTTVTLPAGHSDVTVYGVSPATGDMTEMLITVDYTLVGNLVTKLATGYTSCYINYLASEGYSTVQVKKHLGTASDPVDAYLNGLLPSKWTANHVLRGHAYIIVTLNLIQQEFQGGPPEISVKCHGKKLYDPRTTNTVWSNNPALVVLDYILSPMVGITLSQLTNVISTYSAAATACEVGVTINGATANKYTFNGVITSDENGSSFLEAAAQSMGGTINGTDWSIYAGTYTAPSISLNHMDDVVGGLTVTTGLAKAEIFNTVKGQYTGPETKYIATDFTPYVDGVYKTIDGEELTQTLTFPYTNEQQRIHNLSSIFMEDNRNGFLIAADFSYKAWRLRPGDRVMFSSPSNLLALTSKVFRITDKTFRFGAPVKITMKEDYATIWDLAPSTPAQITTNTNLPNPDVIPTLVGLAATSGDDDMIIDSSGSIVARIRLTWNAVNYRSSSMVEIQYRRADVTTWETTSVFGTETSAYLTAVDDGSWYYIRARVFNVFTGINGDWFYMSHRVVGKTAPPANFNTFTTVVNPDGLLEFAFQYTSTTQPIDFAGAEIRYVYGGSLTPLWSSMTKLHTGLLLTSPYITNTLSSNTYSFAICAVDTTGNYSTTPLYTTVVLGGARLSEGRSVVIANYNEGPSTDPTNTYGFQAGTLANGMRMAGGTIEQMPTTQVSWYDAPGFNGLPDTWATHTTWNPSPTSSPMLYTAPIRDLGAIIPLTVTTRFVATGSVEVECKYADTLGGLSTAPWATYPLSFSARYLQLRIRLTPTGPVPMPILSAFEYAFWVRILPEYIRNLNTSTIGYGNFISEGDIKLPIAGSYSSVLYVYISITDNRQGVWTWNLVDKSITGPRVQFRLDGVLTTPQFIDADIEGY